MRQKSANVKVHSMWKVSAKSKNGVIFSKIFQYRYSMRHISLCIIFWWQ